MKSGVLAIAATFTLLAASAAPLSPNASYMANMKASDRNEEAVFEHLQPVLNANALAGRLYYEGMCKTGGERDIWFPEIETTASPIGTGLAAVRGVFVPRISVEDARNGLVRITIGNVPRALLSTRLARVKLTPEDRYNALLAVRTIESAPEARDAMEMTGFNSPITTMSFPITMPAPGLPHLPEEMMDVTLDEALDMVARTFGGVVLYGACDRERRFFLQYSPRERVFGLGTPGAE
jgi:hypothetical protein